jgi:hypothetical protein
LARLNIPFKTIKFTDGIETYLQVFSKHPGFEKVNEESLETLEFNGRFHNLVKKFNY